MKRLTRTLLLIALLGAGEALPVKADPLNDGFLEPPKNSRPEVEFQLMGGNIAKPGLTADLEAISGAGLSGIQLFQRKGTPWPGIEPQVACLSPQWDDMISHISDECRRLGLRLTMENCPGASTSGGPWITPDHAMRHLVWGRVDVDGGRQITIKLPAPQPGNEDWRDYREVAVLAFPRPESDNGRYLVPSSVRSSRAKEPVAELLEGKADANNVQIDPADGPFWIEVDFSEPITLRSIEFPSLMKMVQPHNYDPGMAVTVEVKSEDGWEEVARREVPRSSRQDSWPLTLALPESTGTKFRLLFDLKNPIALEGIKFSSAAKVDDWEGQAAHSLRSLDYPALLNQDPKACVAFGKIIDLSKNLDADGELKWDAPTGKWTILRFGNVNSGARNGSAPKDATGFECDKLSAAGADQQFAGYIGRISGPSGPADQGRLQGMLLANWECGVQTWTPAMEQEFAARRGYALRDWLPVLAGYVIDDHARSVQFFFKCCCGYGACYWC